MNSAARTSRRLIIALIAAFALIGGGVAHADFSFSPPNPNVGETVTFTPDASHSCGVLSVCVWTFADEGSSAIPAHAFGSPGPKLVTLTETPIIAGPAVVVQHTVPVNFPPSAPSLTGPGTVQLGSQATFTAASTDPEGSGLSYQWAIDGFPVSGASGPSIVTTLSAGFHTISASATDAQGASSGGSSISVFVNRPPVAQFSVSPNSPVAGQTVRFTSTSTDPDGGPITSAIWDLDGDGAFDDATGTTASRAYATSGSRTIRLLVTDANQGTGTAFSSLDVAPKQPKSGPKLLSPFPRVRYAGRLTPRGVRITLFYVRMPKGAKLKATCAKRCPAKRLTRTARGTGDMRLGKLIGTYRPGAVLRISITKKNRIGKYTRISIAKGRAPRRSDKCLWPSSKKPRKCP